MDTVLDRIWTTDAFLTWEDQQEGKHEFDGRAVIPMTGGSVAHQRLVINLWILLNEALGDQPGIVLQEMRLRIGRVIRYPDVLICAEPQSQTTRTVTDATAIFEILPDDTEATDRGQKLLDYAAVPSLRTYVLLEQNRIAATVFQRDSGGDWTSTTLTEGALELPTLNIHLPLQTLYRGLIFTAR